MDLDAASSVFSNSIRTTAEASAALPHALNTSRDFPIRFMPGRHVAAQITGAIKPRAMHVQTHSVFPCAPVLAGNRINLRHLFTKVNESNS
jgi:hypothetical protein